MRFITGIHPVREALRARVPLRWIALERGRRDARISELVEMARANGVTVRFESEAALQRLAGGKGAHQGAVAQAEAKQVLALEDLLTPPADGFLLALDGIEDPHNLGAIVRGACGAGTRGVILPSRRAAGLGETVDRVSAGALEHVQVARVGNLVQALEQCKEAGYWVVGLAAEGPATLWKHDFTSPTVLVIGAEGRGLHQLTRKRCDTLVSIPLAPGVESLNASVAAAVAMFEIVRQRANSDSARA